MRTITRRDEWALRGENEVENEGRHGPQPRAGSRARHRGAAMLRLALIGRGDEKAADQAAVDAMRQRARRPRIGGTVVIGEGERDEAPMLYIGEKVGSGGAGAKVDIAARPARRHEPVRQRRAQRAGVMAMADEGQAPERARHVHGEDRRRPGRRRRHRPRQDARARTCSASPRPRASTSRPGRRASSTGRATPSSSPRSARRRPHPPDRRRRRLRRDRHCASETGVDI